MTSATSLVRLERIDQPVTLPVGRYTVASLTFQLPEPRGRTWSYQFAGDNRSTMTVEAERETVATLLAGLALHVRHGAPPGGAAPGDGVAVTPSVRTPAGLELVNAEFFERETKFPASADIQLLDADGKVVDRTSSGFL